MALLPSDPELRKKVLLGVVLLGGLGYLGYDYVLKPRGEEVTTLQTRLEEIQAQNNAARALTRGASASEIERQLQLYRDQLVTVEGLIPLSEEVPDLLDAISAEAQRTGVDLSLIQPIDATAEQYYTRRSYDIAVLGSYHQIGEFLTRVASLPRIVTPLGLSLAPRNEEARDGQPRLEARVAIETYVIPLPAATPAESGEAE
jgi:type IV pilus assembly protein PilO